MNVLSSTFTIRNLYLMENGGKDLVNHEHRAYRLIFEHFELSLEDWIKLIQQHAEIIEQPLVWHGKRTFFCGKAYRYY